MPDDRMPKPKNMSETEERYFREQEQETRKALRAKLDKQKEEMKAGEHNEHWMKCPKCGENLEEKCFEDVQIDVCESCKGVWLDAGELDLLLEGRKQKGFISRFLSSDVKPAIR